MQEVNRFIMEMEYQKSLNQNYLVYKNGREEENYELHMLAENQIGHLLPVELRSIDGRDDIYYKIGSFQPLSKVYRNREMKLEDVRIILIGLTGALAAIQEYLLDERHVVLLPEYVFIHMESRELRLLFHPFYEGDIREGVREFADYLIGRIDHTEQKAVMMGYQFYRIVREENFIIDDIVKLYREEWNNTMDLNRESRQEVDIEINEDIYENGYAERNSFPVISGKPEKNGFPVKNSYLAKDEYTEKKKYSAKEGYSIKDKYKELSKYNEKYPAKCKNEKAADLKKLLLCSLLALASGIVLCFGIGPYRPDHMAKVLLALIMLAAVLGICTEVAHHIRNWKTHGSKDGLFQTLSSKTQTPPDLALRENLSHKNNYEEIFSDYGKRLNPDMDDLNKQDNIDEDFYIGNFNKRNLKEKRFNIEKFNQEEIDQENFNQKEFSHANIAKRYIDSDGDQNKEPVIYGRTVLLSAGGKTAENILIEKRRGKEIAHQMEEFPYIIGKVKQSVDLVLNDISVSRIHAKLTEENGQVYVQDCNSTNGTFINGVLLEKEEKIPIEPDDEIRIGRVTLLYQ